jgi:hypothetical protein
VAETRTICGCSIALEAAIGERWTSESSEFGGRWRPAYRAFLLLIGDGGAGPPHYGLLRLGEVPDDMLPEEGAIWGELPKVARERIAP